MPTPKRHVFSDEEIARLEEIFQAVDSPGRMRALETLIRIAEKPEDLDKLEAIIRNHDTLVQVAAKENNWVWAKKTLKDIALWVTTVLTALYIVYEAWIRIVTQSIKKISGG